MVWELRGASQRRPKGHRPREVQALTPPPTQENHGLSAWYIFPNSMAKFPSHSWEAPIPKGKSISRNKSTWEVQLQGLRTTTFKSGLAKEIGLNANKKDEHQEEFYEKELAGNQEQDRPNSLGRRKNEMEGGKQEYSGNPQKVLPPDKCANDALK